MTDRGLIALAGGASVDIGLLLGLMLATAIIGGYSARFVRVPRVIGYLLAGVALRWGLDRAGALSDSMGELSGGLAALKSLALGLIMFTIGNVFEVQHLRSVGVRALKIGLAEVAAVIVLVGVGCTAIWVLTAPTARVEALAAGMLLGVVAAATAPAATLLVLQEYDAKGPMSDTILTLTALNNTLSIILFHGLFVVLGALGVVATVGGTGRWVALDLIMTSLGSIALGVVLGFLFSVLFAKVRLSEFLLFFFAVLIGLGSGADFLAQRLHLSFNFLLTCLFLGATFANITVNTGPLAENLKMMATPIMACFFVVAGFELHLDELTHLGWLGFAYVALRTLGKYAGVRLGARWAGATFELRSYLGLGLLCQAGVAIGLADFLAASWVDAAGGMHPLAGHFKTIVLGSVVLFELIGPVALKQVVKSSGEVKAITLLRRPRPAGGSGDSATKSSWRALTRVFRTSKSTGPTDVAELTVGHIMRSNVKFLPASANLDEVLHYVEGSRYNHFPVVDEAGDSVGMIHFADLRDMIYDPQMRNLVTAVDLAAPQDYVPADMPLSELLETFRRRDVGSLVVVQSRENRRVLGLVEQRDLLRTLGGEST